MKIRTLSAALGAVFAVAAGTTEASTLPVSNCNDTGAGSLRAAVGLAGTGDTIDLTSLPCSTITLSAGQIATDKSNLTITGPGADQLMIVGSGAPGSGQRIFFHSALTPGTLAIRYLSMSNGHAVNTTSSVRGGCVYSNGGVTLDHVRVSSCYVRTADMGDTEGGGVFAKGQGIVFHSQIIGNEAISTVSSSNGDAHGGGVYAGLGLSIKYSTISNNLAEGDRAGGGGAYVRGGNVIVRYSTIAGNHAGDFAGAMEILSKNGSGNLIQITNSTISGNSANGLVGGVYVAASTATVSNSTVVANTAVSGKFNTSYYAPGLSFADRFGAVAVTLQSTIIANNTYSFPAPAENDLSTGPGDSVAGGNNLIRVSTAPVPPLTLFGVCPLLGPLRANGGETKTHALLSKSPGIDQGNNAAALTNDQRMSARSSGIGVDIGAYEIDQPDSVFDSGFDGCP